MTNLAISNDPFMKASAMNAATYSDYYNRLKSLAMAQFEWTGLPDEIPVHYIEETLFHDGKILFFRDATKGLMCLNCTFQGNYNAYNDPIIARPIGTNYPGKNYSLLNNEAIVIRNNYMMRPTSHTIRLFSQRLYEVERTLDVNIKAQKFPVVIRATKETEVTLKMVYKSYDGNQPVIVLDKSLDPNAITVVDTKAPYVSDKLMTYKHDIWNEAMTFLGIANSNQDKKERMIVDEANSNNQMVELAAEVMLICRENACKQINKIFGQNISVKMRGQQPQQIDAGKTKETPEKGENDNG